MMRAARCRHDDPSQSTAIGWQDDSRLMAEMGSPSPCRPFHTIQHFRDGWGMVMRQQLNHDGRRYEADHQQEYEGGKRHRRPERREEPETYEPDRK